MRVGISGWRYEPWRGVFYPKGLPQRSELHFASRALNTIEINGSFYSLQRPSSYQLWYRETPDDFLFAVKGPRYITHMKRLREIETPLANFFASGVLALREKLGPILWQFPPNFVWNAERFRDFFARLPQCTAEAAELARCHDANVRHGAWTTTDANRPLRYAVEIRHRSFLVPEFFDLLRSYRMAFVFADTAGKWPYVEELTTDFVYLRLHGSEVIYLSEYSDAELRSWAKRIRRWCEGKERRAAYVYFDNDIKVYAPFDAAKLAHLVTARRAS